MEEINGISENMDYDFLLKQLECYESETNDQALCINQGTAIELTTEVVSVFGQQIIFPQMKKIYDGCLSFKSFGDLRRYISLSYLTHLDKKRKEDINQLTICVTKIAKDYGITEVQWQVLIDTNIRESNVFTGEESIDESDLKQLEQLAAKKNVLKSPLNEAALSLISAIRQPKKGESSKDCDSNMISSSSPGASKLSGMKDKNERNKPIEPISHQYAQQKSTYIVLYSQKQAGNDKLKSAGKSCKKLKRLKRKAQIDHRQECTVL